VSRTLDAARHGFSVSCHKMGEPVLFFCSLLTNGDATGIIGESTARRKQNKGRCGRWCMMRAVHASKWSNNLTFFCISGIRFMVLVWICLSPVGSGRAGERTCGPPGRLVYTAGVQEINRVRCNRQVNNVAKTIITAMQMA
jgi:hypothetical protein